METVRAGNSVEMEIKKCCVAGDIVYNPFIYNGFDLVCSRAYEKNRLSPQVFLFARMY